MAKERITITIDIDLYWKLTSYMSKNKIRHFNEVIENLLNIAKDKKKNKGVKKDDRVDTSCTAGS